MSTRLQVVLPVKEMREIRRAARAEGLTVSEWVRRGLRHARRGLAGKDPAEMRAAIAAMGKMNLPSGEIEQLLEETERGRWFDLP